MNNKLLFQSNNDVPFLEAKVVVHQPTIKEIALIGEDIFFRGSELLTLSKENIPNVGKNDLKGFSNFDIIMATTYDSFEDYIGQDAEETLTKLAAYSAAKSDDQTLLFVVMAHAVLIVLSLIALIVSIVGVCKRGTGGGSITMGVLLTLVGILFAVFVNMTENYSMASGVYVALVFSIVFLVLSIVGKILRTKNKKA